jgi:hypothetical protein
MVIGAAVAKEQTATTPQVLAEVPAQRDIPRTSMDQTTLPEAVRLVVRVFKILFKQEITNIMVAVAPLLLWVQDQVA